MPQFDPASYPSQLFWLTVCFVILYLLMARFVLPRIHDVLETRQNRIASDLDRSEKMKEEAEAVRLAYETALAEARTRSQNLIAETTAAIEKLMAEKQAELDGVISKKLAESEAAIASARRNAMEQMEPVAEELTGLVVEKLIGHKPSAQQVRSAIGELAKTHSV